MADSARHLLSYEEYLEVERSTGEKHEYIDGRVRMMVRPPPELIELNVNLVRHLMNRLAGRPCKVYSSTVKIQVSEDGLFTYPDLAVVCGPRGEKFEHYRRIPTLQE